MMKKILVVLGVVDTNISAQKYRPFWVSVLDLDQNSGFGCSIGHLSLASFLGHKDFVNNLNPKCFEWNPKQVLWDAK